MQLGKEWIQPSFPFLFYLDPEWIVRCPSPMGRIFCFIQSTDWNANLFQILPQGHIQQYCLTSYLGIPWPSEVDT